MEGRSVKELHAGGSNCEKEVVKALVKDKASDAAYPTNRSLTRGEVVGTQKLTAHDARASRLYEITKCPDSKQIDPLRHRKRSK